MRERPIPEELQDFLDGRLPWVRTREIEVMLAQDRALADHVAHLRHADRALRRLGRRLRCP